MVCSSRPQIPTIKVGMVGKDGIVTLLPVDGSLPAPQPKSDASSPPPLQLHVVTHLGPALEVRRDTMLRAFVAQGPTIDIGKETTVSGSVSIPRGYVEIQGVDFRLKWETLTFSGQPTDNPVVVATAGYDAPDGTKVFVTSSGR